MKTAIRPYQSSDIYRLYQICLETGASGEDATGTIDPELLGHIFAAPYVFADPSLCFIVTLDGWPGGYILGTDDSVRFAEWTETHWWPQVRAKYQVADQTDDRSKSLVKMIHRKVKNFPDYFADYPAHLHIDLVAPAQGQGYGTKLMATFLSSLRDRGVAGVHLGVGRGNQRAINWYPRFGFKVIFENDSEVVYGQRL